MPVIVNGLAPLNPQSSDVYVQDGTSGTPQTNIATNVGAFVGTASWGPLNIPTLMGSTDDQANFFGGISAASINDPYDLATYTNLSFAQSNNLGGVLLYGVRVDDGTSAAAAVTLMDTTGTPLSGITLTAKYTGIEGNGIAVSLQPGYLTNTVSVYVTPFAGGQPESYLNLPSVGAGVFWTALLNAINSGTNGQAPSSLLVASAANSSAIAPAMGSPSGTPFPLTGGTDGRSGVTSSTVVGTASALSPTGMYTLAGQTPVCSAFGLCGNTTSSTLPGISTFAAQNAMLCALDFPNGETTANAIAAKKSSNIDSYNTSWWIDWVTFSDIANGGIQRSVPASSVAVGAMMALGPQQSPGNKPVFGILGTTRATSGYPRSAEQGQREQNGINYIMTPIPRGPRLGIRHGRNGSSDSTKNGINYSRMTNFLKNSLAVLMGPFVGEVQGYSAADPTRQAISATGNSFLGGLVNAQPPILAGSAFICNLTNNSKASINAGFCYAKARAAYLQEIRDFIVTLDANDMSVSVSEPQLAP